jgi:BlaI family transcriptional regulator, penicillinase repressor
VPRPTDSELEILHVLWKRGPCTVREVHAVLSKTKPMGYTTVLKLMQIMAEKGIVRRNEDQRAHVYQASAPRQETQRHMVGEMLDRVFGGSASQLVMQALATKKASSGELAQIRRMLDEFERGNK